MTLGLYIVTGKCLRPELPDGMTRDRQMGYIKQELNETL